ncbi:MAG TPA: ATP synthase F1 subunit delta [Chitinivibrionales bacterium]
MLDTTLAVRYASALYNVAQKHDSVVMVMEEMESFMLVLGQDARLKRFFLHPAIAPAEKKLLLADLVGNRLSKLSVTFLSILLDAKRMHYLDLIRDTLVTLHNRHSNKVQACVASVLPIDAALQQKIKERVARYLDKEVDLRFATDPGLLGGLKLTIEDRVIDATVLYNLKKLENKIALG